MLQYLYVRRNMLPFAHEACLCKDVVSDLLQASFWRLDLARAWVDEAGLAGHWMLEYLDLWCWNLGQCYRHVSAVVDLSNSWKPEEAKTG